MKIETLQTVLSFLLKQGITEIDSLNDAKGEHWDFIIGPHYSADIPKIENNRGTAKLSRNITLHIDLQKADLDSREKEDIYLR